jgi:hypothetical protein
MNVPVRMQKHETLKNLTKVDNKRDKIRKTIRMQVRLSNAKHVFLYLPSNVDGEFFRYAPLA